MEQSEPMKFSYTSQGVYPVEGQLKEILSLIKSVKELDVQKKRESFVKEYQSSVEILSKLQLQCETILSVLEETDFKTNTSSLGNLQITLKSKDDICPNILHHCLGLILKYLKNLHQAIFSGRDNQEVIEDIIIFSSKINLSLIHLKNACAINKNDLFAHEETSARWTALSELVEIKTLGTEREITEAREKMVNLVCAAFATIYDHGHKDDGLLKSMQVASSLIYYLARKGKARRNAQLLHARPNKDFLKAFNLLEKGAMSIISKAIKPSIPYSEYIYIPRVKENEYISKNLLINALSNNLWAKSDRSLFDEDIMPSGLGQPVPYLKELQKKKEDTIPVLVISPKKLVLPKEDQDEIKLEHNFENIIIHIHGGGWVSMSPDSHEGYTRTWAKLTNLPIFSIDYRLAPKDPHPAPIDDCWQAYNWIMNYVEQVLNIKPKKVVLVGDSAGGNLVAALTTLLIKCNRRIPDGILLVYPALNCEPGYHSPGYMESIDDDFLNMSLVRASKNAFIEGEKYRPGDPLVSPILTPDYILKKYPRTHIITGTVDGLYDENWRLMERLNNLGKEVSMTVYKGMPHGFLNMDNVLGPPQAATTVRDAATFLTNLIEEKPCLKKPSL